MKVIQKVFEKQLRKVVDKDKMQMTFMPGKGTVHAIFIRRIMKKYDAPGRKLLMVYVDLEKAFDRNPREIIRWAPRRKRVMEENQKLLRKCTRVLKQPIERNL